MLFTDLIRGKSSSDAHVFELPESWMQGRTAYGGLTAALCAAACETAHGPLPPLRSVQVAFVGPAGGSVEARTEILREGKSARFIEASLRGEKGITTRGTLVYGSGRPSGLSISDLPMPDVPARRDCEIFEPTPFHPAFLKHFDVAPATGTAPFMGGDSHRVLWWARHKDEAARSSEAGLLAIGDLLPPAAAARLPGFAPLSSVNWHVDFFGDDLSSEDGWFLLMVDAQFAADGWSSQDMAIWASDGRPVAAGRQQVVIFDQPS